LVIGANQLVWVPAPFGPETDGGAIELEVTPLPDETRVQALSRTLDELCAVLVSAPQTGQKSSCSLQVLISDHWLALDVLPWSDVLLRRDMASAYLANGFALAGHEVATDDIVQVDDRCYGEPCWVVRYPEALLAVLRHFADNARCTLLGCQPLSMACVDLLRKREGFTGVLGLLEGNWLRLFDVKKRSVRPLGHRQFINDSADVSMIWQRTCLCYSGIEAAQPLRLLNMGQRVVPETSQIQLFRPAWLESDPASSCDSVLAIASQVFNITHPLTYRSLAQARNVGQKLWITFLVAATLSMSGAVGIVQSQVANQTPRPVAVEASLSNPPHSAMARNDDGGSEVIRRLNFQVDELLRTMVPSDTSSIWIVSVELDTEASPAVTKVIHLLGQTKGLEEVSAYMKLLSTRPHVGRVDLLRHEIFETDPAKPVRFELEIVWQD
jgi:hypothetical protein